MEITYLKTKYIYKLLNQKRDMSEQSMNSIQGHWALAKMGKKVLRPGGKELTNKMINKLGITTSDEVVEFAPGLGFTANIALSHRPKTYTGIELDKKAAAILQKKINGQGRKIIVGNAAQTTLNDSSADKLYGEAMLTMQSDKDKRKIMKEAARLLRKDGLYGIHEIALIPDDIADDLKDNIRRGMSRAINVNVRPLTTNEWKQMLQEEGFEIVWVDTNPMHLLKTGRLLSDEGLWRCLKITFNILTHSKERKIILNMRKVFKQYEKHMCSIAIVAKKI